MKRAAVNVHRRPERSAAYQVVRENLETWLAQRRAGRLVAGANWYLISAVLALIFYGFLYDCISYPLESFVK